MCSLYDLANVVPTLAKFYHQASEAYEQACTRFISTIILYVSTLSCVTIILLFLNLTYYLLSFRFHERKAMPVESLKYPQLVSNS